MSDEEMWDDGGGNFDDDGSLDDDWDIDSEEERKKEEEKQKAKDQAKTLKQKLKEKEEAEQAAREAKYKEMHREKTQAEIEKEQEDNQLKIAAEQMGFDDDDFDSGTPITSSVPKSSASNSIDDFTPKTKEDFDKLAEMISNKVYESEDVNTKLFNGFIESICRSLVDRQDIDQYQEVMQLGKTITAIANSKQKDFKLKTKGKKKAPKRPTLQNNANKGATNDDLYDDFM